MTKMIDEKLYEDLCCVWDRYYIPNTSSEQVKYEDLKPPSNDKLSVKVIKTFARKDTKQNNVVLQKSFLKKPLDNILPIAKLLIPEGMEAWYKTPARDILYKRLLELDANYYKQNALKSIDKAEAPFSLLLNYEEELFSESIKSYLEGNTFVFGYLAYPATENILRIFVLMTSFNVNSDQKLDLSSILHAENPDYKKGYFLLLDKLLENAEIGNSNFFSNDETISDCIRLLGFLLTGSNFKKAEPLGLNLRNELAHGLIRRKLRVHEDLALLLAWLLSFELVKLGSEKLVALNRLSN